MADCLLITGGSGFVMANVAKEWCENPAVVRVPGQCSLIIFDLFWDEVMETNFGHHLRSGNIAFHKGSIAEPLAWQGLMSKYKDIVTHFVHGAAVTPTDAEEAKDPLKIVQVNILGATMALESARTMPCLKRFAYCTSDAVFNIPGLIRPPSANDGKGPWPQKVYATTKYTMEKIVERYAHVFEKDMIILRFSDVYGDFDRNTGARNRHNAPFHVCHRYLEGKRVRYQGDINGIGADYVYAPDVANGVVRAMLHKGPTRHLTYNLSVGRPIPVAELLDALPTVMETAAPHVNYGDVRAEDPSHHLYMQPYNLKNSRAREEFGWKPQSPAQAMPKYLEWIQKHQQTSKM